MKKALHLIVIAFLTVCCYDDSALWESVNDHETRIARLEESCSKINENISSLLPYLIHKYPYTTIVLIVPFGTTTAHRQAVRDMAQKWETE